MKEEFRLGFIFLFTTLIYGCSKDDKSEPGDAYYFKATINGQPIEWIAKRNGPSNYETACPQIGGSTPLPGCMQGQLPYQGFEGTSLFRKQEGIIDTSSIDVVFVKSYDTFVSRQEVQGWFTDGPKIFGYYRRQCSDPVIDGIVILFTDETGEFWCSSFGDQSANHFEQVSLITNTGEGYNAKIWKVRFSGKLYNASGGYINVQNMEVNGPTWLP